MFEQKGDPKHQGFHMVSWWVWLPGKSLARRNCMLLSDPNSNLYGSWALKLRSSVKFVLPGTLGPPKFSRSLDSSYHSGTKQSGVTREETGTGVPWKEVEALTLRPGKKEFWLAAILTLRVEEPSLFSVCDGSTTGYLVNSPENTFQAP